MKKLSIVIPVYNEKRTVREILRRVLEVQVPLEKELLVVDDCSTDGTRDLLKELEPQTPGMRLLLHEKNQGKGAALRTGFAGATGEIVLVQDADLEYDPKEFPALLAPILEDRADVVYGSRFLGGPHRVLLFWHYLANRGLTFLANCVANLNLTDMETCYKAIRTDKLCQLRFRSDRFGFEPEFTVKVARLGCRIYEVPISYHGRTYAEGKKITWKDGIEVPFLLLKYRFFDSGWRVDAKP